MPADFRPKRRDRFTVDSYLQMQRILIWRIGIAHLPLQTNVFISEGHDLGLQLVTDQFLLLGLLLPFLEMCILLLQNDIIILVHRCQL
jgi:hypothetical protein